MTTSFSYFVRGQLISSCQANPMGTVLAGVCLALIPYGLYCGVRGRRLWVRDYEALLPRMILVFVMLLFISWGIRLGIRWWRTGQIGTPAGAGARLENAGRNGHEGNPLTLVFAGVSAQPHDGERVPDSGSVLHRRGDDGLRHAP
jgi:hypothetical protein